MKDKSQQELYADVWRVLRRELMSFWELDETEEDIIRQNIPDALSRVQEAYNASNRVYYKKYGFSVLNTTVYAVFLYYLSHIVGCFAEGGKAADKIYYLNKIMNGVEWYWNIELPKHFICEHPIGTVLGKAVYGDYLCVYHGVTVGTNFRGEECIWPSIGNFVTLYANATVIGESKIGNYVIVAANTFILNENVPDNSIVFGSSPCLTIRQYSKKEIEDNLVRIWKI